MDEDVRKALLWLAEQVERALLPPSLRDAPSYDICDRCGHNRHHHVVGGDADNPTPWPCAYPRHGPVVLCDCEDYRPMEYFT